MTKIYQDTGPGGLIFRPPKKSLPRCFCLPVWFVCLHFGFACLYAHREVVRFIWPITHFQNFFVGQMYVIGFYESQLIFGKSLWVIQLPWNRDLLFRWPWNCVLTFFGRETLIWVLKWPCKPDKMSIFDRETDLPFSNLKTVVWTLACRESSKMTEKLWFWGPLGASVSDKLEKAFSTFTQP